MTGAAFLGRPTGLAAVSADFVAGADFVAATDFGADAFLVFGFGASADFVAADDFEERPALGVSDLTAVSAATELLAFDFFAAAFGVAAFGAVTFGATAFGAAAFDAPLARVAPAALLVFRAIASNPHSLERLGTNATPPISLNEFLAKYITRGKSKMKPKFSVFQGFWSKHEPKQILNQDMIAQFNVDFIQTNPQSHTVKEIRIAISSKISGESA